MPCLLPGHLDRIHHAVQHHEHLEIIPAPNLYGVAGILRAPKHKFARAIPELQGIHDCVRFGFENRGSHRANPVREGNGRRWEQ